MIIIVILENYVQHYCGMLAKVDYDEDNDDSNEDDGNLIIKIMEIYELLPVAFEQDKMFIAEMESSVVFVK